MTSRLAGCLKSLRHLRGERVLYHDDGSTVVSNTLHSWMRRAQRKAGVMVKGNRIGGQLHILRHTFCSHLAMKGVTPRVIQELAGHTTLAMTMRYMHLAPGFTDAAIRLLDGRPVCGTTRAPEATEQKTGNDAQC
jgi:site-specific recombinase XerD